MFLFVIIKCTSNMFYIINTLRSRQNGRHFADDIFKGIFLNEISFKFVPKGPINYIPALVQIIAWRVQATSRYLKQYWLTYQRIYASLGLNELSKTFLRECWVNILRPRQNGRHFPDTFKRFCQKENVWISIKISLKFFSQGPNLQYSIIGPDNGLAPARRQAIIWTNDG